MTSTNSSTSTKATDVSQPKIILSPDIEENILDGYENPTYHFRLYMMSKRAVLNKDYKNENTNERIIIAESGVSTVGIDDIEIRTVGSLGKESGVGTATNISFTLQEPYGSTLLDRIQKAGYFLGIENFQKFPLFLELSFRARKVGYDENTNNAESDHPLRGLVWTWPIQLTNMAMNVSAGGSTYAMQAVAYSDHAYSNQSSDLEQVKNITTKTIGDFFTQLQQELNRIEQDKAKTSGYEAFDTYQFFIDNVIYNEPIVPATTEELQNRSATYDADDGTMTFSFQPGISIEKICFNVLSLTKYFQREIKATEDPDDPGIGSKANEEAIYQKLWRVIGDADVTAYDKVRDDYARSIKYLVIPYDMTTLLTPAAIADESTDQAKVDSYRNKGLIKKVYNYIYTGMNDQVFDFELNFNFNWFAALPIQGGLSTQITEAEPKAKQTPAQIQSADITKNESQSRYKEFYADEAPGFEPTEQLNGLFSTIEALTSNTLTTIQTTISNAQSTANDAVSDAQSKVQSGVPEAPDPVAGILPSSPVASQPKQLTDLLKTAKPGSSRVDQAANKNKTNKAQQNLKSLDIQIDDIDLRDDLADRIGQTLAEIKTTDADGQAYAGSAGQTLLSAMFEQANSPVSGDLLNIELRVKGDPYWLEPSPVNRGETPNSFLRRMARARGFDPDAAESVDSTVLEDDLENEPTIANSTEGQTLMVFRSFTPQEFDPETGLTPAGSKNSNILNGIYGVREVTHSFSGGEFTQTLHGIRHVNINLRNTDLFKYLKDRPEDTADAAETPPATTDTGASTLTGALSQGTAVAYAGGVDLTKNPLGTVTGVNTSPSGQVTTTPSIFNRGDDDG